MCSAWSSLARGSNWLLVGDGWVRRERSPTRLVRRLSVGAAAARVRALPGRDRYGAPLLRPCLSPGGASSAAGINLPAVAASADSSGFEGLSEREVWRRGRALFSAPPWAPPEIWIAGLRRRGGRNAKERDRGPRRSENENDYFSFLSAEVTPRLKRTLA